MSSSMKNDGKEEAAPAHPQDWLGHCLASGLGWPHSQQPEATNHGAESEHVTGRGSDGESPSGSWASAETGHKADLNHVLMCLVR